MAATRRLVADVAGYSRLMGADEEGTHERLKAHRRELIDPKIGDHAGRIVKSTGDGLLDLRLDQLTEMRLEALVRAVLVHAHQPRVARHIGGEDRGKTAGRGHGCGSPRSSGAMDGP